MRNYISSKYCDIEGKPNYMCGIINTKLVIPNLASITSTYDNSSLICSTLEK
jgi:hypothetical protein